MTIQYNYYYLLLIIVCFFFFCETVDLWAEWMCKTKHVSGVRGIFFRHVGYTVLTGQPTDEGRRCLLAAGRRHFADRRFFYGVSGVCITLKLLLLFLFIILLQV